MKHNESKLQQTCVAWFRLQYPRYAELLVSIPNGGARNVVTGRILKLEGVVAGVADLMLPIANKHHNNLFIEMKTEKGRQSPSQRAWQEKTESVGNKYVICRSLDDFMKTINDYLRCVKIPDQEK